ncbi:DUF3299 domain-containing protein [Rickettsiales bacterium]|nr:DUF3299 domain-containing protein [Rickettsiales bacterium]
MNHYFIFILLILITTNKAFSFEIVDNPAIAPSGYEALKVKGEAIAWSVFAKTKEIENCTVDKEGYDYCEITPDYSKDILALNGKEVTLMGFMFPLSDSDDQTNFLIGPYPLSCPFEYHSPPSQVVEVVTETPVKFSFDPVTVKGVLEVQHNKETGVFYFLRGK